jgi:hypothetical protein|tara:strand:+ start:610 stop:894 length:285 start_codon:yes stop_codon:yes gene_type:complete
MLNIDFNLKVPRDDPEFNTWFIKEETLKKWKYKTYSIQLVNATDVVASFGLDVNLRCDHAGIEFNVGLFGVQLYTSFVDTRHWDHDNNCFKKYD